jgi:hypothetical protein
MAFVTATLPMPTLDDWESQKRWYAVLHTFGPSGEHLATRAIFTGTTADGERQSVERAVAQLGTMLAELGPGEFGDVRVCLSRRRLMVLPSV